MAKRHIEDFNPWPSFVDMFASVIMVVLMFMIVLIVNVAFYAQFEFKVSYTGTVPIDHVLTEDKLMENKTIKKSETIVKTKEDDIKEAPEDEKELITAGVDLTKSDHNTTRQENIIKLDWMVIKYMNNEIVLDAPTIRQMEKFIQEAKQEFPNHYISIFTSEPKEQISATVARQIGLSRALNVRNFIRSLDYKRDDVIVKLKEDIPADKKIEHIPGYVVITINQKR